MKISIEVDLDDADSIAALSMLARFYEFHDSRNEIELNDQKFWAVDFPNALLDLFGTIQASITAMEWSPNELATLLGNGAEWRYATRMINSETKELIAMLEALPKHSE